MTFVTISLGISQILPPSVYISDIPLTKLAVLGSFDIYLNGTLSNLTCAWNSQNSAEALSRNTETVVVNTTYLNCSILQSLGVGVHQVHRFVFNSFVEGVCSHFDWIFSWVFGNGILQALCLEWHSITSSLFIVIAFPLTFTMTNQNWICLFSLLCLLKMIHEIKMSILLFCIWRLYISTVF